MSEHELREIIRCAEAETGQRIESVITNEGVTLRVVESTAKADDHHYWDSSLIQGWKWV